MSESFTLEGRGLSAMEAYWIGAYVARRYTRSIAEHFDWKAETERAITLARASTESVVEWCQSSLELEFGGDEDGC